MIWNHNNEVEEYKRILKEPKNENDYPEEDENGEIVSLIASVSVGVTLFILLLCYYL